MNAQEIQEAVKEVMGKDPIEMVVKYYEGLIQHNQDIIADCEKDIKKLQKRIVELATTSDTTEETL
tara:strand:+ start:526 stop:723 length:198 start_codon:yes stop_codon:yes gene_type:complete